MGTTIRPLEERDFRRVWALYCQGNEEVEARNPLVAAPRDDLHRAAFLDTLEAERVQEDHRHLVAEANGACVAWAHAHVTFTPDAVQLGYISAVYVDRTLRRQGLGTTLLNTLIAWLEGQGVRRIELLTASGTDSRELWLRRGFRPMFETLVFELKKA